MQESICMVPQPLFLLQGIKLLEMIFLVVIYMGFSIIIKPLMR